jgi:flagellar biosynthesis/type III secretory pathway ATPase
LDAAIRQRPVLTEFLKQKPDEPAAFEKTLSKMLEITR